MWHKQKKRHFPLECLINYKSQLQQVTGSVKGEFYLNKLSKRYAHF